VFRDARRGGQEENWGKTRKSGVGGERNGRLNVRVKIIRRVRSEGRRRNQKRLGGYSFWTSSSPFVWG